MRVGPVRARVPRRAFTLVEIMVVLGIIVILSSIFWQLFATGRKSFDEGQWRNDRDQEMKIGFRMLTEDIAHTAPLSAQEDEKYYVVDETKNGSFAFHYNKKLLAGGCGPGDEIFWFNMCRKPMKKKGVQPVEPAELEGVRAGIDEDGVLRLAKTQFPYGASPSGAPNFAAPEPPKVTKDSKKLVQDIVGIKVKLGAGKSDIVKDSAFTITLELQPKTSRGRTAGATLVKEQVVTSRVATVGY